MHVTYINYELCKTILQATINFDVQYQTDDLLCGKVVRVPGYRSRGPGSISGTTKIF
jgi:hypothetical protein